MKRKLKRKASKGKDIVRMSEVEWRFKEHRGSPKVWFHFFDKKSLFSW